VVARTIPLTALAIDWAAPLGTGAYGAVYKAVWSHAGDSRPVAVKFFFTEGSLSPEKRTSVLREVGILSRLGNAHPHIIQVGRLGPFFGMC
jgi:serine/threonine protein kinase